MVLDLPSNEQTLANHSPSPSVCPTPIYAALVQEEQKKTLTFCLIKQIFTFTLNTDDLCAQPQYMLRSCRKRKRKH